MIITALLLLLATGPAAKVNIEDGDVLSDIVTVKAIPLVNAGISKVEFSIDDQLRSTVTKPPYEYKWDTIDEDEGARRLIVSVYDSDGKATSKRIKVEIDNQLSLGIKPHADKAVALFRQGEMEKASLEGRKAYRLNPVDLDAIRAMAINFGYKLDFSRAIDMLEKPPTVNGQIVGDPKRFPLIDPAAIEIRGYMHVKRAGLNPAIGGAADLAIAIEMARKMGENDVAAMKAAHPELKSNADRFAVGDALFFKGDYDAALDIYKGAARETDAVNRCALAMIYANRTEDALKLLVDATSRGKPNGATYALLAMIHFNRGHLKQAQSAVEPGIASKHPAALAVAAYINLAQKDFRHAMSAIETAGKSMDTAEIRYLAGLLLSDGKDLKTAASHLMEAIIRAPNDMNLYCARAYQLAAMADNGLDQALPIFDAILLRDPKHKDAMMGKAIILLHQKKYRAADVLLTDLKLSDRTSADVWVALSALYSGVKEPMKAVDCLAQARKLDPDIWPEVRDPYMPDLIKRVARNRRPAILTPALLNEPVPQTPKDPDKDKG